MAGDEALYKRLRISAILLVIGLVIGAVTQIWIHPLTFMALAAISIPLALVGIVIYIYSMIISRA